MVAVLDPGVLGAVVVAIIVSILAPIIMGWVKGQAEKEAVLKAADQAKAEKAEANAQRAQDAADRRAEKEQDWARQDLVASRAETAAGQLLESQALLAKQAETAARVLAHNTESVADRLDVLADGQIVIHALVNSNMTAAMQAELDAKHALLLALRRNAELEPVVTQDSKDLIVVTEAKIVSLEEQLVERAGQQALVDAQLKEHGTS